MPRRLFRIVNENPPGESDFKTYAERGQLPFRDDPAALRLMNGLSVMDTLEAARRKGKGKPWKSRGYFVELVPPDDSTITIEQTTKDLHHFTVWCDEEIVRDSIVSLVPIEEDPSDV